MMWEIGDYFVLGDQPQVWRVTDVGSRTVVAIRLDKGDDKSWYVGPPYAVAEYVFDEDDIDDMVRVEARETKGDEG